MKVTEVFIIVGVLSGALVGGIVGYNIQDSPEQQLTQTDLAKEICKPDYIIKNGDGLCREMYCRMSANKTDGKVSAQECEQISNLVNSKDIWNFCSKQEYSENCFRLFRERK